MRKLIFMLACMVLFTSCSTLKKIDCKSSRLIPVTFLLNNGNSYTVNVPFCDTVMLNTDKVPDSLKLVLKDGK